MPTATNKEKTWCPAIELKEVGNTLVLKAELPGVEIHELDLEATQDSITIAGTHPQNTKNSEKEIIPSQLHYGQLDCNIPLPAPIQNDHVMAELIGGILTVTMSKL